MERHLPLMLLSLFFCLYAMEQHYYAEIESQNGRSVPVNGIKGKTNLPYVDGKQMPTVLIKMAILVRVIIMTWNWCDMPIMVFYFIKKFFQRWFALSWHRHGQYEKTV